jgi:hypothetical protein
MSNYFSKRITCSGVLGSFGIGVDLLIANASQSTLLSALSASSATSAAFFDAFFFHPPAAPLFLSSTLFDH